MLRPLASILVVLLLLAACGGGDEGGSDASTTSQATTSTSAVEADASTTTSADTTTTTPEPTTTTTASATTDGSTTTTEAAEPVTEADETDWLTIAAGVTIVGFEGENASASNGVRAIDGEPTQIGFSNDASEPVVYVFELPAPTTFTAFSIPDTRNSPGNTTFFGSVEVAGSNTGPEEGFEVLVSNEFVELDEGQEAAHFTPSTSTPVRWIRLTLSGALHVEHEPGKTVVRFTELIGQGAQDPVPMGDRFNGVWELAFLDNPDGSGDLTQLRQDGSRVSGCIGFAMVNGTVTGNVVRLNGIDTRNDRPSAYLFVVGDDGRLRGMESTNNGVFRARIGRVSPEGTTTPCSQSEPEPIACGSVVYVNFDVNSATIRPDSTQVLDDLYEDLGAQEATVVGHTSTEGDADHNQDLSERRAQAVVDELVARGMPADQISSEGRGETEPLVRESDEASRSINRRVEIACG